MTEDIEIVEGQVIAFPEAETDHAAPAPAPTPKTLREVILNLAGLTAEIHKTHRIPYPQALDLVVFGLSNLTPTAPVQTEE